MSQFAFIIPERQTPKARSGDNYRNHWIASASGFFRNFFHTWHGANQPPMVSTFFGISLAKIATAWLNPRLCPYPNPC
jgi:hypothetical protein